MTSIRIINLLSLLLLTGCATQPPKIITKSFLLPTVDPPTLVPVAPAEVACLSKTTYTTIVNRESLLRQWGQKEWNIIDTNNEKATQK